MCVLMSLYSWISQCTERFLSGISSEDPTFPFVMKPQKSHPVKGGLSCDYSVRKLNVLMDVQYFRKLYQYFDLSTNVFLGELPDIEKRRKDGKLSGKNLRRRFANQKEGV